MIKSKLVTAQYTDEPRQTVKIDGWSLDTTKSFVEQVDALGVEAAKRMIEGGVYVSRNSHGRPAIIRWLVESAYQLLIEKGELIAPWPGLDEKIKDQ